MTDLVVATPTAVPVRIREVDDGSLSVEVAGEDVSATVRELTLHSMPGARATLTLTFDCVEHVVDGHLVVDHACGLVRDHTAGGLATGYLGAVRYELREFAGEVLFAGDVFGQQREQVLEDVEELLGGMAERVARAVLAASAQIRLWDEADVDVPQPGDLIVRESDAVLHDLEAGRMYALIPLPGVSR